MSVTSITIELPKCEYCGSQMKFFDEAWVEYEYMLVASILCVNPQCVNSSAIHINAAQPSVKSVANSQESNPRTGQVCTCNFADVLPSWSHKEDCPRYSPRR